MTNKEAIEILKQYKETQEMIVPSDRLIQALCMAIIALEQNLEKTIRLHKSNKETILLENTSLAMITKGISKANKSGATGIFWRKHKNKWEATLTFQGQRHFLGYFKKLEDAVKARKEAEEIYFRPILEKYGRLEV